MSFPKYYLNGIDWITQALYYQCRKTASAANSFIIALELETFITVQEMTEFLSGANAVAELLAGTVTRQKLHLAPYWKSAKKAREINIEQIDAGQGAGFEQLLEDFSNRPFHDKYEHLAVRIINLAQGSLVLFKFDHRLFDGGGGELFIDELNLGWQTEYAPLLNKPDCLSPQLSRWADKFESGRNVNRFLRRLTANGTLKPFTFHASGTEPFSDNRFKLLRILPEAVKTFFHAGEQKLGAFMNTPFLAAAIFNALAQVADNRGCLEDKNLLLPMTVDLRFPQDRKKRLFFNQWSMAPFILPLSTALDIDMAMVSVKEQFVELIKNKFLSDLDKANLLMRIIPLSLYSKISENIFAGTNGSCSFAFLSESGFKAETLAGKKIKNLFHLPVIPPKPGIGIFINRHNDALNIVFSYRDGVVSEQEVASMAATLQRTFKV